MPKTVSVSLKETADRSYPIMFGMDLTAVAEDIASWHKGSAFIITDSNVAPRYGAKLLYELGRKSVRVEQIVFPAGEANKSRKMKEKIENHLIKLKADRHSLVIALGGGVTGDMAGFVAATLFRGIPYVQVPTSLLAQVDSSVGGKVAVDHPLGKNLIGAFHQPKRVYIDVSTLETLPEDEFNSGMAEVIKYGAIMDQSLFGLLEKEFSAVRKREPALMETIVSRCCKLKAGVVEKDERENGLRRIFNFGHTIGHAVELLSNFSHLHGEAIAIGMDVEAQLSIESEYLNPSARERLIELLVRFSLPRAKAISASSIKSIIKLTAGDKKVMNGVVHYTLLKKIGEALPGVPLTNELVTEGIRIARK